MKRLVRSALVVLFLLGAYLVAWPTTMQPLPWEPPPVCELTGPYEVNDRLKSVEWWAKELIGPEAIAFDGEGRLVSGLKDGRIVRLCRRENVGRHGVNARRPPACSQRAYRVDCPDGAV